MCDTAADGGLFKRLCQNWLADKLAVNLAMPLDLPRNLSLPPLRALFIKLS